MRVTLKDIAAELGLSVTTVSRAITGQGRISPYTREQVLKKAQEMGYQPRPTWENGGRKSICIVFNARLQSLATDPFYGTVMVGVENECQKYGYKVFFQTISRSDDDSLWELHESGQLDGLILVGADVYPSVVIQAQEYGIPVVLVDNWHPDLDVDSIVTDNRGGIMRLVNYLVSQGHERIGFIGGPLSHRSLQERYDGYRAALRENGITRSREWCWLHTAPGPQVSQGQEGIEALLQRGMPVTAVITDNDSTAVGVLKGCELAGLNVPDDLSLVGFDNVELSEHSNPPLTTINIYKRRMGIMAARRLHELIGGKDADVPLRITLGTELIVRRSVKGLHDKP
ncbi:MAG: LacI family DNA-binding transcriptional regulator [Bacillota bacterium]|nr:LacI family DNA-binding transcriptional regulator [Bacillota bacterium]HHT90636.1 LacI family transcriptional regulator [Bacillota bacterium]